MLLDGRHRWKACKEVKVEPVLREWDRLACDGDPFLFVWQQHSARRNWKSDEQKLLCYDKLESMRKQAREAVEARANAARSEATKAQPRTPDGRRLASGPASNAGDTRRDYAAEHKRTTSTAQAAAAGVGRTAVDLANRVTRLAKATGQQEVVTQVVTGKVTPRAAIESLTMHQRKTQRAIAAVDAPKNASILVGDFRCKAIADQIPDGSIQLIFTDPPYDRDSTDLLDDLGQFAAAKLEPGGSLVTYVGHVQLPYAYELLGRHLRYWWTLCCLHSGQKTLMKKQGIRNGWKAMLWYVKEDRLDPSRIFLDVIEGEREKMEHEWQQSAYEALVVIRHLCWTDGIVCDPFLGSGTTGLAATVEERRWIGIELDPATAAAASKRIKKDSNLC
jgi:hypothetical protein